MQVRETLSTAIRYLTEHSVGSPRMNAEMLMMFVLNSDRAYLYAHPEYELTADEQSRYEAAIAERATGKPAQYITGHQEFWGMDLIVSPAVLIPRPETEHVVETVLELAKLNQVPRIIDVGTGSGCIALALAKELPWARVEAVDISPAALDIARANAARLQLDHRLVIRNCDLLEGVPPEAYDFVVSNPPYVPEAEPEKAQREVREFEPKVAVFAGESGLEVYRRVVPQAHEALKSGGWLVVEIGFSFANAVHELLHAWAEVRIMPDLQGIPRVVAARK